MKLPELEESVRSGRLIPDGKVCLNAFGELSVTKFAVEPVWYLPGVAERFNIDEGTLRRSLFEHTGGMYPEVMPLRAEAVSTTPMRLTQRPVDHPVRYQGLPASNWYANSHPYTLYP